MKMNTGGGLPVRGGANAPPRLLTVRADALKMPDGTPLKNIEEHRDQDVLCGRGGGTNHHVGNAHWRKLVNANKRLYLSLPKKQKALVAKSIVHAIRAQNPPGRFLARDPSNSLWCDIGDQKAAEKTSQALREGAPDIRTEMAKEGQRDKESHVTGQVLQNGLIGLERISSIDTLHGFKEEDAVPVPVPPAAVEMPASNPLHVSSEGGLPLPTAGGDVSMMMAFHQYLGGKNPSSTATKPTATLSGSTMPTEASLPQTSLLQQQQQQQQQQKQQQQPQQQQPFNSLTSSQPIHSDPGREMAYPQTVMSRKMSAQSNNDDVQNRFRDTQLLQANPQLNLMNQKMMIYNELAQKAAEGSARAGQMKHQAASAMRNQPGQMTSLNNDFGWSGPTGVPLGGGSQLMTDLLRTSSLGTTNYPDLLRTSSLGTTNYPGNNNFTNSVLGNTASMVTGGNFLSQVGSNTLSRLLAQQNSIRHNPLLGKTMPLLDPTNLYSMSSLGRLSYPALPSESSFGGQLSHPAPPSDLGQYRTGGLGFTSLQPSVSAVMAQMKFEQLMKNNMSTTEAPPLNPPPLNPAATQQPNLFKDDTSVSIPTTSAPKRGVSASLDDLCRAAGLSQLQPGRTHSDLAKEGYNEDEDEEEKSLREFCNRVKTKKRTSKKRKDNTKTASPKLGVNDSSLVDDDSDDEANTKFVAAKRKRDDPNISVEEHSKRSKIRTDGVEDKELDLFAHKSEGLRDADLLARGISLNRIASVTFSQQIKSLPLNEPTFDRGHSLAMSEISLDRGQSLSGIFIGDGDDGQFDDASEDEDQVPAFAPKTKKVERGCTLGTINTFPLD